MTTTTLTGNAWVDWPIVAAALLIAYLTLWRRGVMPLFRFARRFIRAAIDIADTVPVLLAEFRPNGGGSLRDAVDRLETGQAVMGAQLGAHLDEAGHRQDTLRALTDEMTALHSDFVVHKGDDAASFDAVQGGLQAVKGAVDGVLVHINEARASDDT